MRSRIRRAALASAVVVGVSVMSWAGVAGASSGGGYEAGQQDCQPFADDWATPQNLVYPGCHNLALNVESGGTSQGEAAVGNTRYLEFGQDQEGNDQNSKGTPTLYSVGYPGNTGSPHAGCLALNTDGTGGGAAPTSQGPVVASQAEGSAYGCGANPDGFGFEGNYDYYEFYCPIAQILGKPCEESSYGRTDVRILDGHAADLMPLVQNGLLVYFGEDDNNDNTEHDGVGPYNNALGYSNDEGAENGSSDGGATTLSLTPQNLFEKADWLSTTHPEGLLNLSAGFCADGICAEGTTQQQLVNHGCDAPDSYVAADGVTPSTVSQAPCDAQTPQNANVYDYAQPDPSVQTESANCNSGGAQAGSGASTDAQNCGPGGMNALRAAEPANEFAEPGLQLFADPDPGRSPALPSPLWPTPALYVGTCGVTVGSATLPTAPLIDDTLLHNSASQLAVDLPGC
jgi:hypothetical protein